MSAYSSVSESHGSAPPVERHPYNDDWGTTFVAILVMACIVFAVLAVLVRKSFRLVPTGVLALRTLVRGPDGHHVLPEGEAGAEAQNSQAVDRSRLELLSDDDDDAEDARVIRVDPPM
ncbi:hypothetical protein IWW56_003826 [Coemansia sp. RSA 2131]|nr:hypothetical protein IWW56_003826 [Coemansia sp. RSA 2131]